MGAGVRVFMQGKQDFTRWLIAGGSAHIQRKSNGFAVIGGTVPTSHTALVLL